MIRKVTKVSTVTPVTKSTGSGVANMGKKSKGLSMYQNKKKSPSRLSSAEAAKEMSSTKSKMQNTGMSMAMDVLKKAALEGHMEAASKRTKSSIFDDPYVKSRMAEDKIRKQRKAVKTGTKVPKPKAKMLPEVTVTAPGKLKRFVSKLTSKRK